MQDNPAQYDFNLPNPAGTNVELLPSMIRTTSSRKPTAAPTPSGYSVRGMPHRVRVGADVEITGTAVQKTGAALSLRGPG